MRKARKKQEETKPEQENLVERLLQGQFFLMVLPVRGMELEEKYQCRSVEREKILSPPPFWKGWRDGQGLMLEAEGVGTCLLSTLVDELPAKLRAGSGRTAAMCSGPTTPTAISKFWSRAGLSENCQ